MHFQQPLLQAILLAGLAMAAPAVMKRDPPKALYAANIIKAIMPASGSCDGARANTTPAGQCRTAEQAAPHFITQFQKYKIYNPGEMAAVLALTALESVELQYKYNTVHDGQGTSNEMQPNFIKEYAATFPELKDGLAQAGTDIKKILDLVTPDEYNFGSGAWYLTTKCDAATREALKQGTDAGWDAYITKCVSTTMTPERLAYWTKAKTAFGLA